MSTETPAPDVPREPSAYRPTVHFAQQAKNSGTDHNRHLDGEIIDGCITRGKQTQVAPGIYWFRETFDAVTYRLVIDTDEREVVTGYPIGIDPATARRGRWSDDQIEDILAFLRDGETPGSR